VDAVNDLCAKLEERKKGRKQRRAERERKGKEKQGKEEREMGGDAAANEK
jgi:hypothetical protein